MYLFKMVNNNANLTFGSQIQNQASAKRARQNYKIVHSCQNYILKEIIKCCWVLGAGFASRSFSEGWVKGQVLKISDFLDFL